MQPSQLNSMFVPGVGATNPATVFKASTVPLRVVVSNIGPNMILLAHDAGTLSNTPAFANTFKLAVNRSETFVLAPQQGLLAVAIGTGGELSIAVSEALPVKES